MKRPSVHSFAPNHAQLCGNEKDIASPSCSFPGSDDYSEKSCGSADAAGQILNRASSWNTVELQAGSSFKTSDQLDTQVSSHQKFWVYEDASSQATSSSAWHNPQRAFGQPETAAISLVQAPASFSLPYKTKKTVKPPFILRISMTHRGPVFPFECEASCHLLNQQQVDNLPLWHPSVSSKEELPEGGTVKFCMEADTDPNFFQEEEKSKDIVFSDLKFAASSRMTKRYIMFCVSLPYGSSLWLLYTLPTIILSRQTSQYDKALLILQDIRPLDGRSLKAERNAAATAAATTRALATELKRRAPSAEGGDLDGYFSPSVCSDIINAEYKAAGFVRPLTPMEIRHLLLAAGFSPTTAESGAPVEPRQVLPTEEWQAFHEWFESELLTALHGVRRLWDHDPPQLICSFALMRHDVEEALERAPAGTFCVRPKLKAGEAVSWAISLRENLIGEARPGVKHILLDANHIEKHTLEVWVRDLPQLTHSMDIRTHRLAHKEDCFLNGYIRLHRDVEVEEGEHAPRLEPDIEVERENPPPLGSPVREWASPTRMLPA